VTICFVRHGRHLERGQFTRAELLHVLFVLTIEETLRHDEQGALTALKLV